MVRRLSAFALVFSILATPAFAMDCEQEFRVRIDRMMSKPDIRIPITDMVAQTRFLVQGFDACMKGDMTSAKQFFERASKSGN